MNFKIMNIFLKREQLVGGLCLEGVYASACRACLLYEESDSKIGFKASSTSRCL